MGRFGREVVGNVRFVETVYLCSCYFASDILREMVVLKARYKVGQCGY